MSTNPNYSNMNAIIYNENLLWANTLNLWCKHYGFNRVNLIHDKNALVTYANDNISDIDLIIVGYYGNDGKDNTDIIKKLRNISSDFLIIAVSADFVTDMELLDTKAMKDAIFAGANRASIKEIKSLKAIIDQHIALRTHKDYELMKKDPEQYFKNINNIVTTLGIKK